MDDYAIPVNILRWFDLASPPYTPSVCEKITTQRASFPSQKLFLDHLLDLAGLDGLSLYPPSTPAEYRRFLHAVYSSDLDRQKRDCFFYYLLRDGDGDGQYMRLQVNGALNGELDRAVDGLFGGSLDAQIGDADRAEAFAKKRCLPRMWRVFMTGYWALDHGQWEAAVDALSDPAIRDLNFLPLILQTLSTHVSPPSHACALIYTLLSTAHETLVEEADREIQLIATCSAGSVPEAFAWIRTHESPEIRVSLRECAWTWVLGASRTGASPLVSGVQAKALKELLHLPLLPEENAHLAHFLAHPPKTVAAPALSLLHDLVTLRFIHQGQYAEALQLDRDLAGSGGGKEEDRQRRREMVREFIGVLPEAQRRVLLAQSEELARERDNDPAATMNGFIEREEDVHMDAAAPAAEDTPSQVQVQAFAPPQEGPQTTPASPAARQRQLSRAHQSPFGGPPRFPSIARTVSQAVHSPIRNISASPFRVPSTVLPVSSPSLPKPPRRIIDDDDDATDDTETTPFPARRATKRKASATAPNAADREQAGPNASSAEAPVPPVQPRRSERIVSHTSQTSSKPSPPPTPASKRTTTRRGAGGVGNSKTASVPGAFPNSAAAAAAPPAPPTPARRAEPPTPARARNTRSASRAILDDDAPPPKRARARSKAAARGASRAASEAPSEVSTSMGLTTPGRVTRRSTRRAATAQPSERGSPTPSVAASVGGGRSTRGGTAKGRETSASATPRAAAKRTRK